MKTKIVVVMDRSGSMSSVKTDTIGGFNQFLKEQKKLDGECRMTYTQFDTEYEIVHNHKLIADVPELDDKSYVPRGYTALLDAIGKTINTVSGAGETSGCKECDREKVIFCIITDGHENASKEFKKHQIKEMIEHKQKQHDWEFIYLGANQDAFTEAATFGINIRNVSNYKPENSSIMYASLSNSVTRGRVGQAVAFTEEEKTANVG
jgi:hypothetical protein